MRDDLDELLIDIGHSIKLQPEEKQDMLRRLQDAMLVMPTGKKKRGHNSVWKVFLPASAAVLIAAATIGSVMSHTRHPVTTVTSPVKIKTSVSLSEVQSHVISKEANWNGILIQPYPSGTETPAVAPSKLEQVNNTSIHGYYPKHYSLEQSRSLVSFTIREPGSIPLWSHTLGEGVSAPIAGYQGGKVTGVSYLPIEYFDFYSNAQGQQLSVQQSLVRGSRADGNIQAGYGPGTRRLSGFGDDLVLIDANSQDGINVLRLYHKETDGSIVQIIVNGNVAAATLEGFALAYMSSDGK